MDVAKSCQPNRRSHAYFSIRNPVGNKNTAITQALSSWWQPGYYRAWNVSMMSHCAVQIAAKSGRLRGDSSRLFSQADFVRAQRYNAKTRATREYFVSRRALWLLSNRVPLFFFIVLSVEWYSQRNSRHYFPRQKIFGQKLVDVYPCLAINRKNENNYKGYFIR